MSIPPPVSALASRSSASPGVAWESELDRRREISLELKPARRRRRPGMLRLLGSELTLVQPGVLREPLVLTGGLIDVAAVEPGIGRRDADHGRFAVLHRLSATGVLPFEQGIEGWLWTARSGSALPRLGEADDTPPNLALSFVRPLPDDDVQRCFEPDWLRALADRSPLGSPSVPGLLLVVADPAAAEDAFRRFGVLGPLTDREIPPSMRRHLPGDKPANPRIATSESARIATSVAPPGSG